LRERRAGQRSAREETNNQYFEYHVR
jgi:hypothetical protein